MGVANALALLVSLGSLQLTLGGYFQAPSYYPSGYPTQPVFQQFLRPIAAVPQRPLQLRPPVQAEIAVPNTRPSVVVTHAQAPQQVHAVNAVPVQAQSLPVVAVHAQEPRKIVLPLPAAQVATVPNYSYSYAVRDPTTGDEKSHEESRTGDNVIGRYTVVEPDGTLRTVTYTAGVHGFNAVVERTPGYAPPNAPVKVVAVAKPVAIAAPAPIAISRPVAIATPIAVAKPVAVANPALIQPPPGVVYPAGFHFG